MPVNVFRGDALAVRNLWRAIPFGVEEGATFTLSISNKDITVTATDDEPATVASLWLTAIQNTTIPEWQEVTASLYIDDLGVTRGIDMLGPADGTPITVTESSTAADIEVVVTTIANGSAGQNNIQRVALQRTPTGGTFTLSYNGSTTGAIAYNASNATIQTALEGLTGIGAGNVSVSGSTGNWLVEFISSRAQTQMNLLEGDGSSLTGACSVSVVTETNGAATVNFIQRVSYPTGGSNWTAILRLYINGTTNGEAVTLGANSTKEAVQSQLDSLVGAANALVSKGSNSDGVYFDIEWKGIYAGSDDTYLELFFTGPTLTRQQEPDTNGIDEVQRIYLLGSPTGGTFTLSFKGQTTGNIAYNASAATVQTALEALSTIGVGEAVVTGAYTSYFTVTFSSGLAASDQPAITGSGSSLTGATFYITHYQNAQVQQNEVQQVAFSSPPSSGNFTLTYSGQTTGNIAYNASASTIQTALEALSNIGASEAIVSGNALGPFTVEFKLTLGGTNLVEMTGTNVSLAGSGSDGITLTEERTGSGPNWWSAADNWTLGAVPVDGDTVVLDGDVPIKYGLTQTNVDPDLIIAKSTFTGGLGLPDWNENGYREYRTKELSIGTAAGTVQYIVGEGEGNGCSIFRVNGASTIVNMRILRTATNAETPAVLLRGGATGNDSRVELLRGSFGYCYGEGETGTLKNLVVGFIDNVEGDSFYVIGPDATVTQITQNGGAGLSLATGHKMKMRDGAFAQERSGWTIAEWIQEGGTATLVGAGTMSGTPEISGDGQLELLASDQNISFANPPQVYGDNADLIDPFHRGIITSQTYLDIDYVKTTRFGGLGQDVRIRRSAL